LENFEHSFASVWDECNCAAVWTFFSIAFLWDGIPVDVFKILKDDAVKVLHSIRQQIWKAQQWPQEWKRSVFIPIPKKGNAKECSNCCTIALISHTGKGMLEILQARLQQYVNWELPDIQAWFRKGRGLERSNCQYLLDHQKSKRVPEKHLFLLYWLHQSLWLCGSWQMWKILQEMGIPHHLTCLLRNLYAGQETTVRMRHGTRDWFQIGKGVCQGCILSPCLFNLYAEYIMWNVGLNEAQAEIKSARRNINDLRYADDTTLMAESEEELKSLLMKVKVESEKAGLKLNIQKTKIVASGLITSWEIDGEITETSRDFFSWAPKSLQMVTADMKLKDACSLDEKRWQT